MIEFLYIHRGSVITAPHGVLICKRSDGFTVLVDEFLNDGSDYPEPEEKTYTMYQLQQWAEQLERKKVFYVWSE